MLASMARWHSRISIAEGGVKNNALRTAKKRAMAYQWRSIEGNDQQAKNAGETEVWKISNMAMKKAHRSIERNNNVGETRVSKQHMAGS